MLLILTILQASAGAALESKRNYTHAESATCYGKRYFDLAEKYCPKVGACDWQGLRAHFGRRGREEGRRFGCGPGPAWKNLDPLKACRPGAETITHWGSDGIGHQSQGALSCMILARWRPDMFCYVDDPRNIKGAGHQGGIEAKKFVYKTVHAGYPRTSARHKTDNCWPNPKGQHAWPKFMQNRGLKDGFLTDAGFNRARLEVAAQWNKALDAWEARQPPEKRQLWASYDDAIGFHVRAGDAAGRKGAHLNDYAHLLDLLPAGLRVLLFGEAKGHTSFVARQIRAGTNRTVVVREGHGILDDLMIMRRVRIFVLHIGSLGPLVWVLRNNLPSVSRYNEPGGRYAGKNFACTLAPGYFWSPGYGRSDCPAGLLGAGH